jgi:hypothetical protein
MSDGDLAPQIHLLMHLTDTLNSWVGR